MTRRGAFLGLHQEFNDGGPDRTTVGGPGHLRSSGHFIVINGRIVNIRD